MRNLSLNDYKKYENFDFRYPGSIQPHGVLLVIDIKTFTIIQVSENTKRFLGVKPKTLLGKPLTYLMYLKQIKNIKNILENNNHFVDIIKLKKKKYDTQFKGIFHRVQDSIIGELETFKLNDNNKNIDYYKLFQDAIINTGKTNDLKKLSAKITEEIRKITKFDRVLIYRFENDDSGVVIAENKREDIESYLGLHYPYYDIPNPARQFFSKKLLRMIPNIHDEPIPILPRKHPLKKKKLDLQNAFLRSIAPCHIEYLKNMGVTASFNISLLKENKLWGLIACHHYSPKYVIYEIRKICELLGEIFSLKLMYEEEKSFRQYRQTIKEIKKRIKEELSKNKNKHDFIDNIIQKNGDSFLKLISARGIAICLDNKIYVKGNTPKKKQIKALINDFLLPKKKDVFLQIFSQSHILFPEKLKKLLQEF